MIPRDFIESLINDSDVVEVIKGYYPELKQKGVNHLMCCPFHGEKTPSFTVTGTKNFYHCFGCGAHGNSLGFIMEEEGLSFVEAIKLLAAQMGRTVPEEYSFKDSASEVLEKAGEYYQSLDAKYSAWGKKGIPRGVVDLFGLGYAETNHSQLKKVFPLYDKDKTLVQQGLLYRRRAPAHGYADSLHSCVVAPLRNYKSSTLGFWGEHQEKDLHRITLNNKFDFDGYVYGIPQLSKAVKKGDSPVWVVKGVMETLKLHSLNCSQVVGVLTNGFVTGKQLQQLFKFNDEVIIFVNSTKEAWETVKSCLPYMVDGKQAKLCKLPKGMSVTAFIEKYGLGVLEINTIPESITLSNYIKMVTPKFMQKDADKTKEEVIKLIESIGPDASIFKTLLSRRMEDIIYQGG